MILSVRAAVPRDAAPVVGLLRAARPHLVVTPELLAWQATGKPAERFGMLVAEADGGIAGVVRAKAAGICVKWGGSTGGASYG
ncbi:hypothetical protein ABT351_34795, partial [Micromonospora sp. NPDC000018]